MPWGDVNQPRSPQARILHLHAFVIQAHRADLGTPGFECDRRTRIPRILHAHPVSGIDEESHRQIERFLHSGGPIRTNLQLLPILFRSKLIHCSA